MLFLLEQKNVEFQESGLQLRLNESFDLPYFIYNFSYFVTFQFIIEELILGNYNTVDPFMSEPQSTKQCGYLKYRSVVFL